MPQKILLYRLPPEKWPKVTHSVGRRALKTKCHLWEEIRNHFRTLRFDSMADLLTALIRGIAPQKPVFENSS